MNMKWRKMSAFFAMMVVLSLGLCGCGDSDSSEETTSQESTEEEAETVESDVAKQVGEPIYLTDANGGTMTLTINDWGKDYETLSSKKLLYVEYEIENTGDTDVSFGNSVFEIYADDYTVEQSYIEDGADMLSTIAPGRKANAKLYGVMDPDNVTNIELQINDIVIAIKGEKVTQEGIENQLITPEEVDYAAAAEEYISDISGYYQNTQKKSENAEINIYPEPEGNVIGTASTSNGYEGELVEITTNVYQLICDESDPIVLSFTYGSDGSTGEDGTFIYKAKVNVYHGWIKVMEALKNE